MQLRASCARGNSDTTWPHNRLRRKIQLPSYVSTSTLFNNGDASALASFFAVPGSILDGMAPHIWSGPTATQDWYRDALTEGAHLDVSGYFVTLGEPLQNNVTGQAAYVVLPATMKFNMKGKQVTQSGAFSYRRAPEHRRRVAYCVVGVDKRHSENFIRVSFASSTGGRFRATWHGRTIVGGPALDTSAA